MCLEIIVVIGFLFVALLLHAINKCKCWTLLVSLVNLISPTVMTLNYWPHNTVTFLVLS